MADAVEGRGVAPAVSAERVAVCWIPRCSGYSWSVVHGYHAAAVAGESGERDRHFWQEAGGATTRQCRRLELARDVIAGQLTRPVSARALCLQSVPPRG